MTRGVLYYNRGTGAAVRLLVSLASLRRHYTGPVTILSDGEDSHILCERIAGALGADLQTWTPDIPPGRHTTYLAKMLYRTVSPYDVTVCIDNDTLIVGAIDELFGFAEGSGFAVAQLAGWRSNGATIGKRIRAWSEWLPEMIGPALAFGPAINCGVVAFRRDAPLCNDWYRHALPGRDTFIPDEVCCQILLPRYPHAILDGRWNRSCKHDDPSRPDTRIIHYHGRKHCRPGLPYDGARWVAAFDETVARNLAGVREWLPTGDRMLRRFLRWRRRDDRDACFGTMASITGGDVHSENRGGQISIRNIPAPFAAIVCIRPGVFVQSHEFHNARIQTAVFRSSMHPRSNFFRNHPCR